MGYRLDESAWPVVVATWQGTLSDDDLTSALSVIDRFLAREERFGLLLDVRGASGLSPEQRGRVVAHMKANGALTARYLIQANVLDSALHRTLFYAINLLLPNPFPAKAFSNVESARAWLVAELAKSSEPT